MRATIYTVGKVSKKLGTSSAAAVIEGLEEGRVIVTTTQRPNLPTPNSVAMHAIHLGVGTALAKGADELTIYTPSKNAAKAVDGTGGADYATRLDCFAVGWVIYWRSARCQSFEVRVQGASEMPEAEAAARVALESLTPEPAQGALFA